MDSRHGSIKSRFVNLNEEDFQGTNGPWFLEPPPHSLRSDSFKGMNEVEYS